MKKLDKNTKMAMERKRNRLIYALKEYMSQEQIDNTVREIKRSFEAVKDNPDYDKNDEECQIVYRMCEELYICDMLNMILKNKKTNKH